MKIRDSGRNAMIDAWVAHVGASPRLRLLTGLEPTTIAASETGTLIRELGLPSTWMNAASGGQATKAGTWSGTSVATGTIGYARLLNNASTQVHWQGTVTAAFSLTTSASTAANNNVLTFAATAGVVVGQGVYGPGVPAGATVAAVGATTVTLSAISTAGVSSGAVIMFGDVSGDMMLASTTVTSVGQSITVDTWTLVAPGA